MTIVQSAGLTERAMRDKAMAVVRSRLWAREHGIELNNQVVATYDLPDGEEYPHELRDFRK